MPELAVAYISIVPETSKIAPGVRSALSGVDGQATAAGRSMGDKMSGALGAALKTGAAAAGAAAAAGIGVALTNGFQRLSAIDDAKGKLEGLGHSTQSTAKIMDSALTSVKGTAYGLGDAATVAASAVAAGIKPGEQLTKYLSSVGDAASIAGVGLSDMGRIFNQVQTGQKAYTEDLNQLAERGIPIYQWLGEEMGVAAGEVKKLASDGKISSEVFFQAIDKNIGGAALSAGKTVRGSFQNMLAALGRLGAAAQQPAFGRLPGLFASATKAIDAATPGVAAFAKAFDAKVFDEWAPKLREVLDAARDSGAFKSFGDTMRELGASAADVAVPLGRIMSELGRASAALGISTWQLFVTALQAASGVLTVIEPALSGVAGLMEDNRMAVTALMAAWLAFKTVPGIVSAVGGPVGTLTSQVTSAGASLRGFGQQMAVQRSLAAMSGQELGRVGSAMAALGTHSSTLNVMQQRFYGAADGASRLSRSMSAARAGASSLVSAIGPNVAITAAVAGFTLMASQLADNKAKADATAAATQSLATAQRDLGTELRKNSGLMTEQGWNLAGQQIDSYAETLRAAADEHRSFWESSKTNAWAWMVPPIGLMQSIRDQNSATQDAAKEAMTAEQAFKQLGMSNEQLKRSVFGSAGQWSTLRAQLESMGPGGQRVAADLANVRREFEQQRNAARQLTPGISELGDAMRVLGDETSTTADKSKALKSALDALNPARSAGEALARHSEVVREIAKSTQEAIDQTQGFGDALLSAETGISPLTANGAQLRESLLAIVDASSQAAEKGQFNADMQKRNAAAFGQLATQYRIDVDKIKGAADKLGYDDINLIVRMSGATETQQQLAAISQKWKEIPNQKSVKVESSAVNAQTRTELERMGFTVKQIPGTQNVEIRAKTDAARQAMLGMADLLASIPAGKPINVSAPGGQEVAALLRSMGVEVQTNNDKTISAAIPAGSPVLETLKAIGIEVQTNNGKTVLVKADDADYQAKRPGWTATENKLINVEVREYATGSARLTPNADGAIRGYIDGGIAAAEAFANGGFKHIQKPTSAKIFQGSGAGTIFAEKETGGEAYIPLAASKRRRSTDILAKTAEIFGLSVVRSYADGGFSAEQLKELAEGGHGASRPLTGAPYDWAGVNWGDCSGAMSAFTRAAAGLAPFGGRWSTGSAASDLPAMGFTLGRGGPGTMRVGWYNGGPGGGHTAGTLPDGTNVEMGGGNGGGMMGGSVGADASQFTDHAYIAVGGGTGVSDATDSVATSTVGSTTLPDATTSSPSPRSAESPTSISGLAGAFAKDFVGGQVASLLDVFGINDSPSWMSAINDAKPGTDEPAARDDPAVDSDPKPPSPKTLREAEDRVADTEQRLKTAKQRLKEVEGNAKSKESTGMAATGQVAKLERDLQQARDDLAALKPRDPGTTTPARGEDVFDRGGLATGIGLLQKKVLRPERVLSPAETAAFQDGMRRGFAPNDSAVLDMLREMRDLLRERGGDTFHIEADSTRRAMDDARRHQQQRAAARLAGV